MQKFIGKNVLITTNAWFYGPDGLNYRGVWGRLMGIHEAKETLGITPNRPNTNWFVEIGDMTIAGCQVLYCVSCELPPPQKVLDERVNEGNILRFERNTEVYITKEVVN